jgi:hypothetical protein
MEADKLPPLFSLCKEMQPLEYYRNKSAGVSNNFSLRQWIPQGSVTRTSTIAGAGSCPELFGGFPMLEPASLRGFRECALYHASAPRNPESADGAVAGLADRSNSPSRSCGVPNSIQRLCSHASAQGLLKDGRSRGGLRRLRAHTWTMGGTPGTAA